MRERILVPSVPEALCLSMAALFSSFVAVIVHGKNGFVPVRPDIGPLMREYAGSAVMLDWCGIGVLEVYQRKKSYSTREGY